MRYLEDVEYVINQLSQSPPWSLSTSNPCAYRLAINAAAGAMDENGDGGGMNEAQAEQAALTELAKRLKETPVLFDGLICAESF